jgi:hypothetical protein
MTIVELVRLSAAHLGLGLLPVTPIAMGLIFLLLLMQRNGRTVAVSMVSFPEHSLLSNAQIADDMF